MTDLLHSFKIRELNFSKTVVRQQRRRFDIKSPRKYLKSQGRLHILLHNSHVMPRLCPQKAANEAKERNLQPPITAIDGRYPTLKDSDGNQYGAVSNAMDTEFSEFITIASDPDAKVLEIGAAYGSPHLLEAFKSKTTASYTAADILGDQLRILARKIEESYPSKLISNLTLVEGAFPHKDIIHELQEGGYDAILAINVFHFFTEDDLVEAFKQVYRLLKPGGKFFAKMMTPYIGLFEPDFVQKMSKEILNFIDHFDRNQKNRPFPGFVTHTRSIFKESLSEKVLVEKGFTHIKHFFLFDKEITQIMLKTEGFETEICEYKESLTIYHYDGRESLILIVQKPSDHSLPIQ